MNSDKPRLSDGVLVDDVVAELEKRGIQVSSAGDRLNEAPEDLFDNWYARFVNRDQIPEGFRQHARDLCQLSFTFGFNKAVAMMESATSVKAR